MGPRRSHELQARARGPGGDNAVIARAAHSRSDARLHQAIERACGPLDESWPPCGARDRSPTRQGAPPQCAACPRPKRATYDNPRGLSGDLTQAGSEKSRHPARGMPPPPSLNRCRPAFRVTGATPSGRPGPRASNSHKGQAGAAPFKERPLGCVARALPAIPRHAGQRASFAQARGVGGWRAGGAAGGTAASRRAAAQAGPARERKTPRSRANCRPRPSSRAMAASSVRSQRARPRTGTSGARVPARPAPLVTGRGRARQSHGARRRAWRPACRCRAGRTTGARPARRAG